MLCTHLLSSLLSCRGVICLCRPLDASKGEPEVRIPDPVVRNLPAVAHTLATSATAAPAGQRSSFASAMDGVRATHASSPIQVTVTLSPPGHQPHPPAGRALSTACQDATQ